MSFPGTGLPNPYNLSPSSSSTANLLPTHEIQPVIARGRNPSLRSVRANNDSPYSTGSAAGNRDLPGLTSISDKYSLSPDPAAWGNNLSPSYTEPDDYLHNPDPRRDRRSDFSAQGFISWRSLTNLGCIFVLSIGLLALFAGYPIITHFTSRQLSTLGGFGLGGINASGQIPVMNGNFGLIDAETPADAYTKPSFRDGSELQLVFSDEFNTDGRTFYPGDDPYWEAVDLHYWATNNMEWYDPAAISTSNGALEITLSEKQTHGLNYQGGMVTSWNKFCFTGGLFETSVTLPGTNNIAGLWPAVWALGNLGRAGYGATLDGMWPYTYDACDVGAAPNQTINGLPLAATVNGDASNNGILSFLPGQRLSRCTCPGESHPGPVHEDGSYVGRSAPEIDVFEAQTHSTLPNGPLSGQVSQSAQWGPFNEAYDWFNNSDTFTIADPTRTAQNTYKGGVYQQATSSVTATNQDCYQLQTGCFAQYAFEYKPGFDDAYILWTSQEQMDWTILSAGTAADPRVQIAARPIPQEPMYLIANLGMSTNFGTVDLEHLTFPAVLRIDYIRVYQRKDSINIGCDPENFPTATYIDKYIEAYTNANLTTWVDDFQQPLPKNNITGSCT